MKFIHDVTIWWFRVWKSFSIHWWIILKLDFWFNISDVVSHCRFAYTFSNLNCIHWYLGLLTSIVACRNCWSTGQSSVFFWALDSPSRWDSVSMIYCAILMICWFLRINSSLPRILFNCSDRLATIWAITKISLYWIYRRVFSYLSWLFVNFSSINSISSWIRANCLFLAAFNVLLPWNTFYCATWLLICTIFMN
jgi:hypothetical protein